jgi:hypothetical protein
MLPLAIGLMAVGGAGMAYGMMKGRQKYNSPNYNDIDLAKDNPALYAELMKYQQMVQAQEALYNQRGTGPTMSEERARSQQLADMRSSLAARGSLGGSTEFLAQQDLNARFQDEVAQRTFQQQQAMMQQLAAMKGNQYNMYAQAQGDIMNKLTNEAMMDYQSRQAQDQARNQFFSGLMSGGMGLYGAKIGADASTKNAAILAAQNARYQGVPTYQPNPAPHLLPLYPTYQQPQQSPMQYQYGQYSPYYRG